MDAPLVLEVRGNSLDDGPGIRTVVFFKGCPLDCAWCHNPESKQVGPELAYDRLECVGCHGCVGACGEGAIDPGNEFFVDRDACNLCLACVDVCPSGALSVVGRSMTVDEIVEVVESDRVFFENSGGGVTLSGGEATLFLQFCGELARELHSRGVEVLLETCGQFDLGEFLEHVYPYLSEIYYDLKLVDPAAHRVACGVSNERILANFEALVAKAKSGGVPLLARVPLVPGITTTPENLDGIAALLKALGVGRVALLEYNPTWLEKAWKVGVTPRYACGEFMTREELERCRTHFQGFELA
ncbi:MAG: glycyl-radical enzyme activating protein [Promethearchaeota archaeon]